MAKVKTRVCPWCKKKDMIDIMVVDNSKKVERYYHMNCHEEYKADAEFKEAERVQMDSLANKIAEIYQIPMASFPQAIYIHVQNIRNGMPIFGNQQVNKRYKEGYEYALIEATFDYCRKDIEYHNRVKDFDSVSSSMRYGLRIIIDKIMYVSKIEEKKAKEQELLSVRLETNHEEEFVSNYKKTENKRDISAFLD